MADEVILTDNEAERIALGKFTGNSSGETIVLSDDNRLKVINAQERQGLIRADSSNRDALQIAGDVASGATSAFLGAVGDAVSFPFLAVGSAADGVGLDGSIFNNAAQGIQQNTQQVTASILALQSKENKDQKQLVNLQSTLDEEDNKIQLDKDLAEDSNSFLANLKSVGRSALDAGGRIADTPTSSLDIIASGIGSIGFSGKLIGVASKIAVRNATGAAGIVGKESAALAKESADLATALSIGTTEALSVHRDTAMTILQIPHADLMEGSQVYRDLISQGLTPDAARKRTATLGGNEALALTLPAAIAFGKVAGKLETNPLKFFKGKNVGQKVTGIAAEGVEETLQGAGGTFASNVALQRNADEDQRLLEGVGSAAVEGLVGGIGTAGTLAIPSTAGSVLKSAAKGTIKAAQSETTANILDAAGTGAKATSKAVSKVTAPVVKPVAQALAPVAEAVGDKVQDVIDRPNEKIVGVVNQAVAQTQILTNTYIADKKATPEAVSVIAENKAKILVSPGFTKNVTPNGTILSNIQGILAGVKSTKIRKLADSDLLFANTQINELQRSVKSLPADVRTEVQKVLASTQLRAIVKRASEIDQNKLDVSKIEINEQVIADTLALAEINPTAVHPELLKKIFTSGGASKIPKKARTLLKTAGKISEAVNKHVGGTVEVAEDGTVSITPGLDLGNKVSRSILLGGFKDVKGNKLRSINDFVADITKGARNEFGTFPSTEKGSEGILIRASDVAKSFGLFTTHLANKVDALNRSAQAGNGVAGLPMKFASIVGGTKIVPAGHPKGSKPITLHPGREGSVALAQNVFKDATVAAEVHNLLVEQFPDLFPNGKITVPTLVVKKQETKTEEEAPIPSIDPSDIPEANFGDTDTLTDEEQALSDQALSNLEDGENNEEGLDDTTAVETSEEEVLSLDNATEGEVEQTTLVKQPTTKAEFDNLTPDDRIKSINGWDKNVQHKALNKKDTKTLTNVLSPILEQMGLPDVVKVFAELITKDPDHNGHAYWGEGVIALKPEIITNIKAGKLALGKHVLFHELMHLIDGAAVKTPGRTLSMDQLGFDPLKGELYKEIKDSTKVNKRSKEYFSYALGFKKADTLFSELFAELGAAMILDEDRATAQFPKGIAYVKQVITKAGGSQAPSQRENTIRQSDTVQTPLNKRDYSKLDSRFNATYKPLDNDIAWTDAESLLNQVDPEHIVYQNFITEHLGAIVDGVQSRLSTVPFGKVGGETVYEHILSDKDSAEFRNKKALVFVNTETGLYDPTLLGLAATTVLDWMTTTTPGDPSRMEETLENLGLSIHDVTEENYRDIATGVPPNRAVTQITNMVMKSWNMKIDKTNSMVDVRAVEGLIKEIILVASQETDLIRLSTIKINLGDGKNTAVTINIDGLKKYQDDIGIVGRGAIQKAIAPELDIMPSFDKKIDHVDTTQERSDVPLGEQEQIAIKNMQDTPHKLATNMSSFATALGYDFIKERLGYVDMDSFAGNATLRLSVDGLNTSIRNNWDNAQAVIAAMSEGGSVYYGVGVTKVGRHQQKGINPQSNKILRALVTPTNDVLDMTSIKHQRAFWLTVAQASGINKVENENHDDILASIQGDFAAKYGDSIAEAVKHLNGETMNLEVMAKEMGNGMDMQQMSAILTVASLKVAPDLTKFETSLSFELDGKTDGPANLMANFGQGLLTALDHDNFQRVGFFLGVKNRTLNHLFGKLGFEDLYEVTSLYAEQTMYANIAASNRIDKEKLYALARLTVKFGDFASNTDEDFRKNRFHLTRNSSKNPMTKTVYGSGIAGVGKGLAHDMMIEIYSKLASSQDGVTFAEYLGYPGVNADIELLFGQKLPDPLDPATFTFSKSAIKQFEELVVEETGSLLSNSAKEVIGSEITNVNNHLVFMTSVQANFLDTLFTERLAKMVKDQIAEGKIKSRQDLAQSDYDALVEELRVYAPLFSNGSQTLAVGGFEASQHGDNSAALSATLDGNLRQSPSLQRPAESKVKIIPYISIGRGDAMMMNEIYSADDAPENTLSVFDGIDMRISDVLKYSDRINTAVLKNWDSDILISIVEDFESFLRHADTKTNKHLLSKAYNDARIKSNKNSNNTLTSSNSRELLQQLQGFQRKNKARKDAFKQIPLSVDHMGGSGTSISRGDDTEMDRDAINVLIQDNLDAGAVAKEASPLEEIIQDSTAEHIDAHYAGDHNPNVARLEILKDEFLGLDFSNDGAEVVQTAVLAKDAINGLNTPAEQMNAFLLWSLTNEKLVSVLKTTRTSVLAKLSRKVKASMARIMGGNLKQDIYSNVAANVKLLNKAIKAEPIPSTIATIQDNKTIIEDAETPTTDTVEIEIESGTGGSNDNSNSNGELTPEAHDYSNFWIDLIKERLAALDFGDNREERTEQLDRYKDAAALAVRDLTMGGFSPNEYEQQTFRAIHMVIAMETRLDPQTSDTLNSLFTYVTDNLKPEMFGSGRIGQERFSTVMTLMGNTENDEGMSDAIAVFFALSQSSKGFRAALDKLPRPPGNDASTLSKFVTQTTAVLMRKAVGTIDIHSDTAVGLLNVLSKNLLIEESNKEFSILRPLMGSIDLADKATSGLLKKAAEITDEFHARKTRDENSAVLTKRLTAAVAFATSFLDAKRGDVSTEITKNMVHAGMSLDSLVPIQEFVNELVGSTEINQASLKLLDSVNKDISQVRQAFRIDLPAILTGDFNTAPTAAQWKLMYKAFGKNDFASVYDKSNPGESIRLITSDAARGRAIDAAEALIDGGNPSSIAGDIKDKALQLAKFMTDQGAGHQLITNAYAINKLTGNYVETDTAVIDRLVTLYAIEELTGEERSEIHDIYANNKTGVRGMMVYIQALNLEEDLKEVTEAVRLNGYKGYIPDHPKEGVIVQIANDSDEDTMIRKGFVKLGAFQAEDDAGFVNRSYYVSSTKQGGSYSQGVIQTVQDTFRGVSISSGLSSGNHTSGVISGAGVDSITRTLNASQSVTDPKEVLLPRYDDDGVVVYYERVINPDILETYAQPEQNLSKMIGSWAGRQVEEKFAQEYNRKMVDESKRIYDEREPSHANLYVDISDPELSDVIYRDSWAAIPPETKKYIRSVYGDEGGFFVRKDMINLSLGFREPSITDVWTGKTRLPDTVQTAVKFVAELTMGKDGRRYLVNTEKVTQDTISYVKDAIIVRSLIVPYMNTQANVFQLNTRGVPMKTTMRGYRNKYVEIEKYNLNRTKLIALDVDLKRASASGEISRLKRQIAAVEAENARMSISPVVDAGAYKNISEGITELDVDITSGNIVKLVDGLIEKIPSNLAKSVIKNGVLSKDTTIYKIANRAVQYGDFIAKSIYYDHLLSQGVSAEDALTKMNEEFVNFSAPAGRARNYLESLGATWFLSFKIRIAKISLGILRDNPVRALITANTVGDLGSPVNDNLFSVIGQDRIDYALGWDMLFGAPDLNPWVQLMNWD